MHGLEAGIIFFRNGSVDRLHPVAGPSGALRASKFAPGELVAALHFW